MIAFSHYSGCGNDFILIDDRDGSWPFQNVPALYMQCAAHLSHFPDGIIFIKRSLSDSARMDYFNKDGSCASMCGNGLRCVARFLHDLGETCTSIEVSGRSFRTVVSDDAVLVDMGMPQLVKSSIAIIYNNESWTLHLVDAGVPHLVTIVTSIDDIVPAGRYFRQHQQFQPEGANVNFVILTPDYPFHACIRTYERGVEAETLACGTGALAAAFLLHTHYGMPSALTLQTRSKKLLEVACRQNSYWMKGEAVCLGRGSTMQEQVQHAS